MAPMIEVKNLSKHFRDHVAVDCLTFSLEPGEILGFLGPNGAGKTTTMRMITGAMPPTEGTVAINGFDVFESPMEVKRRVGYLPEIPPVYLDMTVGDYMAFCARLKGLRGKVLKSEIQRVMDATHIGDESDRLIGNLSKGYRQRVGIAQAILGAPPVLILDEPTVGLDPVQIIEVRSLIRALADSGKHTIILSTHILHEVAELCGKILVIKSGQKMAFDTPQGLVKQVGGSEKMSIEEAYLKLVETTGTSQTPSEQADNDGAPQATAPSLDAPIQIQPTQETDGATGNDSKPEGEAVP